jgi:hypothetical protein
MRQPSCSLAPAGRIHRLVVKIKRTSPEHPQQFQGVLRLAEGSKRVILSTRGRGAAGLANLPSRLSREDNSLDAAEMRDKAVAALGGVAYLTIVQALASNALLIADSA